MFMMPVGILPLWFASLLSISLLGGGLYIGWAWHEGVLIGFGWLCTSIGMLLVSFFGRYGVLLFVGLSHETDRSGGPPVSYRSEKVHRIERPDGTLLYVEEYGPPDAPTIVLTHGWGLNGTAWGYTKQALAGSYRLLVWDLPGLGRSRSPTRPDWSLEKMASDLEAVTALAGDSPQVLAGHSIGGMITLTFCRLYPELLGSRVKGVILENTTFTNPVRTSIWSGLMTAIQKPVLEPLARLQIGLFPLIWLSNWLNYLNGTAHLMLHLLQFGRTESRGQLEFITRYTLTSRPDVLGYGMLGMFRYDATGALQQIPVPALILTGARDHLCVPAASEFMQVNIPDATLMQAGPAGHLALVERSADVNAAFLEFARRCFHSDTLSARTDTVLEDIPVVSLTRHPTL